MSGDFGTGYILTPPSEAGLNELYLMRAALPPVEEARAARPAEHFWRFGFPALNQGNTGTCSAQMAKGLLLCEPVVQTTPEDSPTAFELYDMAITLDGVAANDGDVARAYGTTANGVMKALRQLGYIAEWRWARNIDDVKDWLANVGPVGLGTPWYSSMFSPDRDGFISISGGVDSSHAFMTRGYGNHPLRGPYFRCVNSWGPGWGQRGEFNISEADFQRLVFQERGEAIATSEVALVPKPIEGPVIATYQTFDAEEASRLNFDAIINDHYKRGYLFRWQPGTGQWPQYDYQETVPLPWARERGLLAPEVMLDPSWRVIIVVYDTEV